MYVWFLYIYFEIGIRYLFHTLFFHFVQFKNSPMANFVTISKGTGLAT